MQVSNYPPDYNDNKHLIDDPVEAIEEVTETDTTEDYEESVDPLRKVVDYDSAIIEEAPLFDVDE